MNIKKIFRTQKLKLYDYKILAGRTVYKKVIFKLQSFLKKGLKIVTSKTYCI